MATKTTNKKVCSKCGKAKVNNSYYQSNSSINQATGTMPICKDCTLELYKEEYRHFNDITLAIHSCCQMLDVYYDKKYVTTAINSKKEIFPSYITQVNSLKQCKNKTYKNNPIDVKEEMRQSDNSVSEEMIDKWGDTFTASEIKLLESEEKRLSEDVNTKYSSSRQFLKLAVINYVRSLLASQRGDVDEAKDYTKLYADVMKMGEFTPSALSKNSIADKISSFSEASLMVEECVDVVELHKLLPNYMIQPKDNIDKVLWYLVAYMERVLGKPVSTYEDIYAFYKKMENIAGVTLDEKEEVDEDFIPNFID